MNIAIYSRKSKFTGKGDSIGNQIDRCRDYINFIYPDNKVIEITVFEDEGFSGKNTARPGFKKMMSMVKSKEIQVVVVYQLNRLGRKVKDILETIDIFKEYNCGLHSVTEKIDTSSPMGTMFLTILASIAQFERDDMIQRITDNMYILARNGRWLGGQVPLGFNHTRESYFDAQGRTRYISSLTINEEEIDTVIQVYHLYLEMKSISQVHKYLLKDGVRGKKGGYINKSSVKSILINPNYVMCNEDVIEFLEEEGYIVTNAEEGKGILTYCKRSNDKTRNNPKIASTSKHTGIIKADDWLKVQEIMDSNKGKKPNRGNSSCGLLSGILRCSCGAAMNIIKANKMSDGTRPYYYSCSMKINSGGTLCRRKNINGMLVDNRIIEEVVGYDSSKVIEELDKILNEEVFKEENEKKEEEYKKIQSLKNKKSNMFIQLSNLDVNEDKDIIAEYQNVIRSINKEINEAEKSLAETEKKLDVSVENEIDIEEIRNRLQTFKDTFEMLDHEDKKRILRSILDNIVWDDESNTIRITYTTKKNKFLDEL
ncbi:recombinase family protein [Clostridium saudiense]|uniref:recombinase family protein n=1 Tax=Clostridium saudiense TaxID=1414720 RepID=UPI00266F845B|nr:recombinase family protein [Clostridium saudiense]